MSKPTHYPQKPQRRHSIVAKNILLFLSIPLVATVKPYSTSPRWTRDFIQGMEDIEKALFPPDEIINEEKIRNSLYNLKKRGYIKHIYSKDKTEVRFELTKKGREIVKGYQIDDMNISKKQKWDGQWRFVVFDIPEKRRHDRDIFREKLENIGFFRIQQSVWIFPYDCEKEIDLLSEYLGLKPHVLLFTGKVNQNVVLVNHFRKLGFMI